MINVNKRGKRFTAFSFLMLVFTALLGFGLTLSNINFNPILNVKGTENNPYTLVLNSSNKVTSIGDVVQKTNLNNDVTFTYANVKKHHQWSRNP